MKGSMSTIWLRPGSLSRPGEPGRNSLSRHDYMQTLDVPFQVRPARSHVSCDVYCEAPEDGDCWLAHPPTSPKRTRAKATTLMRFPPFGASPRPLTLSEGTVGLVRRDAAFDGEIVDSDARGLTEVAAARVFRKSATAARAIAFARLSYRCPSCIRTNGITAEEELISRPQPSDRVPHPPHHCRRVHAEQTEELFRSGRANDVRHWDAESTSQSWPPMRVVPLLIWRTCRMARARRHHPQQGQFAREFSRPESSRRTHCQQSANSVSCFLEASEPPNRR